MLMELEERTRIVEVQDGSYRWIDWWQDGCASRERQQKSKVRSAFLDALFNCDFSCRYRENMVEATSNKNWENVEGFRLCEIVKNS